MTSQDAGGRDFDEVQAQSLTEREKSKAGDKAVSYEKPADSTADSKSENELDEPENDPAEINESSNNKNPLDTEDTTEAPPLPDELPPPLPAEAPPAEVPEDDGWAPVWEESSQAFYFYNRFTGTTQWTNPRVSEPTAPGVEAPPTEPAALRRPAGGYDPAIHGDYDPTAWYAQASEPEDQAPGVSAATDPADAYAATAAFNRFTGRFQNAELVPENFNDENKSKRQMNAFFDVDAAANSHDGRSLREERSGKKLTKAELKKFKEKRKAKKDEKRKAWLRD
jgi:hypothetical protein